MEEVKLRVLSEDEYSLIENHPFLTAGIPHPEFSRIVVAEQKGEIVGFHMLVMVPHLEPIWVAPEYRGTTLAVRLWNRTLQLLDDLRLKVSYCFSERPDTDEYLTRLGLRQLPYKTFLHDPHNLYPKGDS